MTMETKTCRVCGRELPLTDFRLGKGGARLHTCNECVNEKRAQTRYEKAQCVWGGKSAPFSDPSFDNLSIGEVVRLMGRAKKWLESRGCKITLYGDFIETKTKKLKFE